MLDRFCFACCSALFGPLDELSPFASVGHATAVSLAALTDGCRRRESVAGGEIPYPSQWFCFMCDAIYLCVRPVFVAVAPTNSLSHHSARVLDVCFICLSPTDVVPERLRVGHFFQKKFWICLFVRYKSMAIAPDIF